MACVGDLGVGFEDSERFGVYGFREGSNMKPKPSVAVVLPY